jgi:hypothetical protein
MLKMWKSDIEIWYNSWHNRIGSGHVTVKLFVGEIILSWRKAVYQAKFRWQGEFPATGREGGCVDLAESITMKADDAFLWSRHQGMAMKAKNLGFLLAIPVASGLLISLGYLGYRNYEKSNQAALERIQVYSEIRELYFSYCRDYQQPPSKLEGLEPYAEEFPRGFEELRSGRWIILWGTPSTYDPKRNKERVIGHENMPPDPNRWLLTGDGGMHVEWYNNHLWREEASVVADEIGELYLTHSNDKGKPPGELANLRQYAARFPNGYEAI